VNTDVSSRDFLPPSKKFQAKLKSLEAGQFSFSSVWCKKFDQHRRWWATRENSEQLDARYAVSGQLPPRIGLLHIAYELSNSLYTLQRCGTYRTSYGRGTAFGKAPVLRYCGFNAV